MTYHQLKVMWIWMDLIQRYLGYPDFQMKPQRMNLNYYTRDFFVKIAVNFTLQVQVREHVGIAYRAGTIVDARRLVANIPLCWLIWPAQFFSSR